MKTKAATLNPKGVAGSLGEVVLFATTIGAGEKDAKYFWYKCEGCDWTNAGRKIKDWRATFTAWWEAGFFPSQRERFMPSRRFTSERRHETRRAVDVGLGECSACKAPWKPDGKGGIALFCKKHEGKCMNCCGYSK